MKDVFQIVGLTVVMSFAVLVALISMASWLDNPDPPQWVERNDKPCVVIDDGKVWCRP